MIKNINSVKLLVSIGLRGMGDKTKLALLLLAVAVLLYLGLTELPNIANLLDKITGGPGTVWEDFLKVIGLGGEV